MLHNNQVEQFFVDVLKFPNWKDVKESDIMEFLKQLVQRYQYYCYFHNQEMASTPPEKRKSPVVEDTIRIGVAGTGGVCIHQNSFMTLILQAIGFDAFITAGTYIDSDSEAEPEGNHCMCILKVGEEEIYAIDVGCGQPVDGPIPLHNLPFSGISAGFRFEYRYNQSAGRYERWQFDGSFFRGKFADPNASVLRYTFTLIPKDNDYFTKTLFEIFTNAETSIFLQTPFLFRSIDLESEAGENGRRFILIFGASLVIYDNVNREVTDFTSYKELKPSILKYFPKIDPSFVENALGYFCSNCTKLILGREAE